MSDNKEFQFLKSALQQFEDFENLEIKGEDNGFDAMIGVSTRFFVTDGHLERRRLDAIECMHRFYRTFGRRLTHTIKSNGAAVPLNEREAFEYFRSEAGVDDTNVEALLLGLAGFPGGELESVPLQFETRLGMQMTSWSQYNIYSEWAASTNFSALGEPYHEALLRLVLEWAPILKPRHGTSDPGFLLDQTGPHVRTGRTIFPHLKRFPGLDYDDGGGWITLAYRHEKIRSINWLTLLDDAFVDELGGLERMIPALGPECPVHPYDGGIVIQAGPKPEIGDTNRGSIPEPYRSVARVVKPIRLDTYSTGLLYPPKPLDPLEETLAWIARFD